MTPQETVEDHIAWLRDFYSRPAGLSKPHVLALCDAYELLAGRPDPTELIDAALAVTERWESLESPMTLPHNVRLVAAARAYRAAMQPDPLEVLAAEAGWRRSGQFVETVDEPRVTVGIESSMKWCVYVAGYTTGQGLANVARFTNATDACALARRLVAAIEGGEG